jgi:hypothetical protein
MRVTPVTCITYLSDSKKSHGVRCAGCVGEASALKVAVAGASGWRGGRWHVTCKQA